MASAWYCCIWRCDSILVSTSHPISATWVWGRRQQAKQTLNILLHSHDLELFSGAAKAFKGHMGYIIPSACSWSAQGLLPVPSIPLQGAVQEASWSDAHPVPEHRHLAKETHFRSVISFFQSLHGAYNRRWILESRSTCKLKALPPPPISGASSYLVCLSYSLDNNFRSQYR